jgi:hypothetical protein
MNAKLDALGNVIPADQRPRIEAALAKKVPKVSAAEITAFNLVYQENSAPSTASAETAICPGRKAPRACRRAHSLRTMGSLTFLRRRAAKCELPTGPTMSQRRFPPPWSIEETAPCFIVRDANKQALAFVYCEDEPGRRTTAKLFTRNEARRIAANIAKLPELLRNA